MPLVFVDEQLLAQSTKTANEPPGLLFVECSEHNGRAPQQTRTLRKRHIMRTAKTTIQRGVRAAPGECDETRNDQQNNTTAAPASENTLTSKVSAGLDLVRKSHTKGQDAGTAAAHCEQSAPQLHGARAITFRDSAAVASFASVKDVATVWQWFFYGHDVSDKGSFNVARWHFMDKAWEKGRDHEISLNGVSLYARRKRIHVSGSNATHQRAYLQQKGQLIKLIQAELNDRGSAVDTRTLLAIGPLAYCHLQDAEPEAVATHFAALRAMSIQQRASPSEWLIIVWMDLRLSLALGIPPMLEYYIPRPYRELNHSLLYPCSGARRLADRCSREVPLSEENGFGYEQSFHLFLAIFQLSIPWLQLRGTRNPPYGHLYGLEYNLRVLHARISGVKPDPDVAFVELILIAMQLQVWILARFWTPIAEATRAFMLRRGRYLLEASYKTSDSTSKQIFEDVGCLSAFLWALSIIAACATGGQDDPTAILAFRALGQVVIQLGIDDETIFLEQLRNWPWVDDWHAASMSDLWRNLKGLEYTTHNLSNCWWNIEAATIGPKSFGM